VKSEDVWRQYQEYTDLASNHARKLGFAAGGLLWILRDTEGGWSKGMRFGLLCVVIYFTTDILQYVVASVRRRVWIRGEEVRRWREDRQIDGDYDVPESIDRPVYALWWIKLASLVVSFATIAWNLVG
jgi:hypothetical protein